MGPLAQFLLALQNLVRSGAIKKIPQAIKFAEQQFGKVTPLLKKQIEKIFESIKKPVVGKPGKKEGAVLPFVRDAKKTEGIETLDDFNLSKDDPMGDLEKIVKGEGDTGLPKDPQSNVPEYDPEGRAQFEKDVKDAGGMEEFMDANPINPSRFTEQEIDAAIDNVSPGFSGDMKYDAELVADDLAQKRFDKEFYDLDQKQQMDLYDQAYQGLSKSRFKQKAMDQDPQTKKLDELMNFFRKEIEKADAPELDSKENIMGAIDKLINPKRPGGPLDPVIGVTRTLARRVLEKRGIEIGKKDPIDVFNDTFGEAIVDLKNLGEEMIEADQTGRNLKPMDDLLEIEGFFDMEIPENPNKGIPTEEVIEMLEKDLEEKTILEDFDPTDREPNAEGGLMRTKLAMGGDPLPEDPTKPVNPFGPKPTGPVLPDKSMMAEFSLQDYMDEFERVFPDMIDKRGTQEYMDMLEDYFRGLASKDRTGGRVQAASGGLAEILKV